ncbi:MAG: ABC transporter permease [Acidobacteria bacterium]|nr:ABC transporter permease [Acidobacteriota bacterium]
MNVEAQAIARAPKRGWVSRFGPDVRMGLENLLAHKLRSLLTMLGMICGVAAVVAMLSIGAGAQQQVMAFIENLGVRNLIVEAREATDWQSMQKMRAISPGLTFNDVRLVDANVPEMSAISPRKRFTPTALLPRPARDMPVVFGVAPAYQAIAGLTLSEGRFFDAEEAQAAAPVAVLGDGVADALFPGTTPIDKHVKVNEQWLRIVGVIRPQMAAPRGTSGLPADDRNNLIYVPVWTAILRLEDTTSGFKDEIDGMYVQVHEASTSPAAAQAIRGLLDETHKRSGDYSLVVPAELLAEQQRTQRIFQMVMVAIASISLLVGGIGIMNIMLASVMERTREIGVRRAVGATQAEVVRQFLIEATIISGLGGVLGVVVGVLISRLVAYFAGWTTVITPFSVVLAFTVSVAVGLLFGVYPARKAARLDPVKALHYE